MNRPRCGPWARYLRISEKKKYKKNGSVKRNAEKSRNYSGAHATRRTNHVLNEKL